MRNSSSTPRFQLLVVSRAMASAAAKSPALKAATNDVVPLPFDCSDPLPSRL